MLPLLLRHGHQPYLQEVLVCDHSEMLHLVRLLHDPLHRSTNSSLKQLRFMRSAFPLMDEVLVLVSHLEGSKVEDFHFVALHEMYRSRARPRLMYTVGAHMSEVNRHRVVENGLKFIDTQTSITSVRSDSFTKKV